jgi:hypothetical protein
MRMHPRRRGAYNFSARLASSIVNSHYKNKKKRVPTNGTGCLVYVMLVVIIVFLLVHVF